MKTFKTGSTAKKNNQSKDSFLEAFRDLGSDFVSTTSNKLIKPGVKDFKDELFPFTRTNTPSELPPSNASGREAELEARYRSRFRRLETIHHEEKILFTREQKETQRQVSALQEDIKKMAKATGELAREVEIASMQNTPVTGDYHVNFFIRLRKLISTFKSQIQESSFWLSAWNKKSQKKNYYWGQFKKSGSKFLLSADRYMATQAG